MSYLVHDGVTWFTNFADQRIYRVEHGAEPVPVTAAPPAPVGVRFADLSVTPDGRHLIAVRETHDAEVVNDVAVIDAGTGHTRRLVGGHDFFAAPRLSPDGSQLAWLSWDHPNMPWDGSELWLAPVVGDAASGPARLVAGGATESVSQPRWSPDGRLHYVSDRSGWWNLYVDDGDAGRALAPRAAEFAGPDWSLGQSSFTFLDDGTLVAVWHASGRDHLGWFARDGALEEIDVPFTALGSLAGARNAVVAVAGSPTEDLAVVRIAIPHGDVEVLARGREVALDPAYVSVPEPIEFPTEHGLRRARIPLPPCKPRLRRPGRRTSSARRRESRRAHVRGDVRVEPSGSVLDEPGFRGRRRRLRREYRLRPRRIANGCAVNGASSTSTTASTRRIGSPTRGRSTRRAW